MSLQQQLIELTDEKIALILMILLPPRTIDIANAILDKEICTDYIKEYANLAIDPMEFADIMDHINDRIELI